MYAYSNPSISDLIRQYAAANSSAKKTAESALIARIENDGNYSRWDNVRAVIDAKEMGEAILLKALDVYSRKSSIDTEFLTTLLEKDLPTSIKKGVLDIFVDRGLILTLAALKEKPELAQIRSLVEAAIVTCEIVCIQKGHTTALATFRQRYGLQIPRVRVCSG